MRFFFNKLRGRITLLLSQKYANLKSKVVIVYSLGKVGSTTVYSELKKITNWNNVFHVHFLSDEWLKVRLKQGNHFNLNFKTAQQVFNYLKNNPKKEKHIITLVREPVSRELSNFMQNPQDFTSSDLLASNPETLMKSYLSNLSYDYTLNWFDTEFLNYTGFDVFSKPFNKTKGYSIYSFNGYKVLIIKLEQLNNCYKEAMADFLGVNLELKANANQTANKPISKVYNELKQYLKFEKNELEHLYKHKYVTHFYTNKEIQEFVKKYSK